MSQHEITVEITDESGDEVFYPEILITFTFVRGAPEVRYQRNGDPGWPADPDEVEFVKAALVDGHGMTPTQEQIDKWAEAYLDTDRGFEHAVNEARENA